MYRLFILEIYRTFTLQIRYPIDFISGIILLTSLFYGLLVGAEYITGAESFNANLSGIIVGYSVWMVLHAGMNNIPGSIQGEAQRGTLEALFLSSFSATKIFFARAVTDSLVSVLFTMIVLFVLLWITGRTVSFSFWILIPTIFTILAAIGVGMIFGGFALLYKQVNQVLVLAQYPLLFLMMTPFENMDEFFIQYMLYLPVVPSAITLREIMVGDMNFFDTYYIASILNGLGYLLVGVLVFKKTVIKVKKIGGLSGY